MSRLLCQLSYLAKVVDLYLFVLDFVKGSDSSALHPVIGPIYSA